MPKHVFKIENGVFGLTLTAPSPAPATVCLATITPYDAFTCQIQRGVLTASPNITQETVGATWCDPEENIPLVGATSYTLEINYLQDLDVIYTPGTDGGLSQFLYEHDAELAYFFMGMDGTNPPLAIGKVRLVSGEIGGDARVALTATATLPCETKPAICFGNATVKDPVGVVPTEVETLEAEPEMAPA